MSQEAAITKPTKTSVILGLKYCASYTATNKLYTSAQWKPGMR